MAKFMVLYSSAKSASELMAQASPEEMKASMAEWMAWKESIGDAANFDFGSPLQAVGEVTPGGTADSASHVSEYSTIEGESKDAVVALLKTHPHLKRAGASIDVLEMLTMPGM